MPFIFQRFQEQGSSQARSTWSCSKCFWHVVVFKEYVVNMRAPALGVAEYVVNMCAPAWGGRRHAEFFCFLCSECCILFFSELGTAYAVKSCAREHERDMQSVFVYVLEHEGDMQSFFFCELDTAYAVKFFCLLKYVWVMGSPGSRPAVPPASGDRKWCPVGSRSAGERWYSIYSKNKCESWVTRRGCMICWSVVIR